eukprot:g77540.t1
MKQVTQVYRKKYVIHIEQLTKEKNNGQTVQLGVHPSKVMITKLHLDPNRKSLLERKKAGLEGIKGKHDEESMD